MSFDLDSDAVVEQRQLRLEHRLRRAQSALAGARAAYGALRETPDATALQLHLAFQQVQRAQGRLGELQREIDLTAAQGHAA